MELTTGKFKQVTKIKELILNRVEAMPVQLEPGVLYISERFKVAAHLCACGCESRVVVPLGNPGFSFLEKNGRPTLYPSIGNWQLPCKSHYFITNGWIEWCSTWTPDQIQKGLKRQQAHLEEHYKRRMRTPCKREGRLKKWLASFFRR